MSFFLLDRKHWLQALLDIQRAVDDIRVEAPLQVRFATRQDGHQIVKRNALKLINLANMVTSIVSRAFLLVVVLKSETNFYATYGKDYGASFFAARMVDIVKDMLSSDFLTGKSLQTY